MRRVISTMRGQGAAFAGSWRAFWFALKPAYTLGLVRIAFGALVFLWALELKEDLYDRFGSQGFFPQPLSRPFVWSMFHIFPSDNAVLIGWIALIVGSIALIVGWHSRLAAILVFVLILSFERRNPVVFNAGDALIRIEALFLALGPCGAALSLDQRRRTGSFFSAQERKLWVLRLMQIQVSVIYLATVVAKLNGDTWQDGTAVSYTLRLYDMLLLPTPSWLASSPELANIMTWGTLLAELAIGVLVWSQRWRARVLFAGVVLHLSIMLTVVVGFFSIAMFVLYLAFIPADRTKALAESVQKRLIALTSRFRRRQIAFDDDELHDETDAYGQPARHNGHRSSRGDLGPGKLVHPLSKRSGYPPPNRVGDAGRDVRPRGRPRRDPVPVSARVPVRRRDIDDEPSGRHARRPSTDLRREFDWPDDVRRRLEN
jgi:hypothetical protein